MARLQYETDTEPSKSETLGSTDIEHTADTIETDDTFEVNDMESDNDTTTSVDSEEIGSRNEEKEEVEKRREVGKGTSRNIKPKKRKARTTGKREVSTESDFECEKPYTRVPKKELKTPEATQYTEFVSKFSASFEKVKNQKLDMNEVVIELEDLLKDAKESANKSHCGKARRDPSKPVIKRKQHGSTNRAPVENKVFTH